MLNVGYHKQVSESDLCSSPVSSLSVITKVKQHHNRIRTGCGRILPDGVSSAETDPVRHWSVLLHLNSQRALGAERFLGRLHHNILHVRILM